MKQSTEFTLTNANIQQMMDQIQKELTDCKLSRKEILRLTLIMEETLLNYQDYFGVEKTCQYTLTARFKRKTMTISISGDAFDPFKNKENGSSEVLVAMLVAQGLIPQWKYEKGSNIISFTYKKNEKNNSTLISLCLSIVLAVAFSFICKILPTNISTFVINEISVPVYEKFLGVISAIAGPLIFLSVIWGIFSIGDTASLSRIGSKMIGRFILMLFVTTIICFFCIFPFYHISAGGGGSFAFSALFKMILDIIPTNVLTPFTENNPLQIIFMAVVVGIAALLLAEKTTVFTSFIEQANYVVTLIMETITKLVPMFIFLSVFNLMTNNQIQQYFGAYKLLLTAIGSMFVALLFYTILICAKEKVSPVLLWKKMLPTFLIALTTCSSSATFGTNMDTCKNDFGIDEKFVNIGVPLGQVLFKIGTCITYFCVGLYMAEFYHIDITWIWLITTLFLTVILAVAAPPIPGGTMVCYTILFTQLGVPQEGLALCCAINVITDFFQTPTNINTLQMELIRLADSLNFLNHDILLKEKK